jgi:hypothetical protein
MSATPEVIRLVNEGIRPTANDLAALYYSARVLQDRLDMPGGVGSLFEALTGREPIDDGAERDGRPVATPENVKLFIETVRALLEDFEANDKAKLRAVLALASRYK